MAAASCMGQQFVSYVAEVLLPGMNCPLPLAQQYATQLQQGKKDEVKISFKTLISSGKT